jgi:hypothetical protein
MAKSRPEKLREPIAASTAAEVCERVKLGDAARGMLHDGMSPRQYLGLLIERGMHTDAIRFLAHALPKREAIWWGCLCAEQVLAQNPSSAVGSALGLARAWVIDPTDNHRRAALPAAEAAEFGSPAGCLALAVYFSGGSLGPPQFQAVPPGEHLSAHMVTCALTLAAVISEPEKAPEKYATFLDLGLEIADGRRRWPHPPTGT